jgi:hypothetical protein
MYAPHGPKDSLWLLISATYEVKQAARQYFTAVVDHATGLMKMIQSQRDPCVHHRVGECGGAWIAVGCS